MKIRIKVFANYAVWTNRKCFYKKLMPYWEGGFKRFFKCISNYSSLNLIAYFICNFLDYSGKKYSKYYFLNLGSLFFSTA